MSEEDWKSPAFRQNIVSKLHDWSPHEDQNQMKKATLLEKFIFRRSKSSQEYLDQFSKILVHYKNIAGKAGGELPNGQSMEPDLMAALESLNI